ncbi:MAG: patatin-like phospholipase family protein [Tannerella sp.]|jgi:NTE family protein|nr:patatin-like phospholipase family protein [Tannerella sp.]
MKNILFKRKRKPYSIGLALSGGGAKGFAHIGVFRALEEFGIRPDIISGTSVGALMGSLFADGYSAGEIEQLFDGREFTEFAQIQLPKSGIFDSSRFSLFLEQHLRARRFEELQIPLIVVATDLDSGKSHAFTSGPIAETVRASCSIPVLFSPVLIDGVHYVDGGLFHNFPVSFLRPRCEYVIGVNVSPCVPRDYSQNLYGIAERSFHYLFRANTDPDRKNCDILIETGAFGQYRMFDLKNIDRIVRTGYRTALETLERFLTDRKKKAPVRSFLYKFPKLKSLQIHPPVKASTGE